MALVPDVSEFQAKLEGLPVRKYRTGENILSAGSATGRLLVLKSGAVEVSRMEYSSQRFRRPARCLGS